MKLYKYLYPLSWVLLALPTLLNIWRRYDYKFYLSYLTGSSSTTYTNIANGLFFTAWFLLATLGYFLIIKYAGQLSNKALTTIIAISVVSALITVPFSSTDIFYYLGAAKGEILNNINPYLGGFIKYNPFYSTVSTGNGPIMYPPFWLDINKLLWIVSNPLGLIGQMYFYKLVFLGCHIITAFIIFKTLIVINYKYKIADAKLAALTYLLNPLLIYEFATNAHYDAVMLLFIATGIYFLAKQKAFFGLTFMAGAILVKFTAIIFLPFAIVYLLYKSINNNRVLKTILKIILAGATSLVLALELYLPYGSRIGLKVFDGISLQSDWFVNSLFSTLYVPIIWVYHSLSNQTIPSVSAKYLWLALILVAVIIFIRFVGESLASQRPRDNTVKDNPHRLFPNPLLWFEVCTLSIILFLTFAQRSFWPWYASWALLPALFLDQNNKIRKFALIFTFSSLAYYIPLAFLGQNSVQVLDSLQILYGSIIFIPVIIYLAHLSSANWRTHPN